jgi:ribose transport system ATP-binding protein
MLAASNISKRFGGVTALSEINLELQPAKVNAIIGENGAGKSTLMKIFSGVITDYEGEIIYGGQPVRFANARQAEQEGIAIIHQELSLIPFLTVAENIFLGKEPVNRFGILDKKKMNEVTRQLLLQLKLDISPNAQVAGLRIGQQQLIEIAKALHSGASVIIMDEPTSAISDKEVENLFHIIRQLKAEGKTIVYISHKLNELFTIADRYFVLRDGEAVAAGNMKEVSQDELIQQMTGRKLNLERTGRSLENAEELMTVRNISLKHPLLRITRVLSNLSFSLHKGEILGVYGLMGAGRTELMECIFGLHPKNSSGEIFIQGKLVKIKSPSAAIEAGIALVPEDRKGQGLILSQTVQRNISITILKKILLWDIVINSKKEKKLADDYSRRLAIKTSSTNNSAKSLSGGNQQKIVLAKWLATNPRVLLLDEPTRGIDINAKTEIYKVMKSLAAEGMGIIMVSSELPEIMAVSDRVMVLCEGKLTAILPADKSTEGEILKHAIQIDKLS